MTPAEAETVGRVWERDGEWGEVFLHNSERNKYVYSLQTFVIQIKYKRHYSFSSNEPPLIFSQRLAGRATWQGKKNTGEICFSFLPKKQREEERQRQRGKNLI